ncbi:MAG: hypothetical protein OEY14_02405 [Myxococcales bacterium]|nr:hypothetical protein [Myxococcales bacterium]
MRGSRLVSQDALLLSLLLGCAACASTSPEGLEASDASPESAFGGESSLADGVDTPFFQQASPPITEISRASLVAVLDAGLGRFLQGVGTEPHLEGSRFVGFRLTRLYPAEEAFASLELGPGDTILRVNGQSIERPEQAMRVWEELRVASELWIEYLREDQPHELRIRIID